MFVCCSAYLQKTHPGIVMSVKSQHAGRRLLNTVEDGAIIMRKDGMLDESEAEHITKVLITPYISVLIAAIRIV
jgi:hypothetical protein